MELPNVISQMYSGAPQGQKTWYGQGTMQADGSVISASGQQIQGPRMGGNTAFSPRPKGKKSGMGGSNGYGSIVQKMANSMMNLSRSNQAANMADLRSTEAKAHNIATFGWGESRNIAESTYGQTVEAANQGLFSQQQQIALNLANQQEAAAKYGTAYGNLLQGMRGTTEQRLDRLQPQIEASAAEGRRAAEESAQAGFGRFSELALQREQFMRDDVALTEQRRTESLDEYRNALSQFQQDRGTTLNAALDKRIEGARQYGLSEKENIKRALLEHNAGVIVAGAANGFSTSLNAKKQEGLMKSLQSTSDVNFKKQQLMDAATNDWTAGTLQTADNVLAGKKNVSDILDGILSQAGNSREAIGSATSTALATAVTGFNEAVLTATTTQSKQVTDFIKDKVLKVDEAEKAIDAAQISALQLLGNLDMKLIENASQNQLDVLSKNVDRIGAAIKSKGEMNLQSIKDYYAKTIEILTNMASLRTAARDAGTKGVMDGYGMKFDGLNNLKAQQDARENAVMGAAAG
jgi:hypothetical protein